MRIQGLRGRYSLLLSMAENREGGTEPGALAPDGQPFVQELDSRQADAGLVGRFACIREPARTALRVWSSDEGEQLAGEGRERAAEPPRGVRHPTQPLGR